VRDPVGPGHGSLRPGRLPHPTALPLLGYLPPQSDDLEATLL
jgi:hypothetical protein